MFQIKPSEQNYIIFVVIEEVIQRNQCQCFNKKINVIYIYFDVRLIYFYRVEHYIRSKILIICIIFFLELFIMYNFDLIIDICINR